MNQLQPDPASWEWLEARLGRRRRRNSLYLLSVASIALLATVLFFLADPFGKPSGPTFEALQVGDHFPELTLDNQFGSPVSISSLQGNVVLVEFWASYSKICTDRQCYYFKPIYEEYAEKGFEIYGISLDTSAREWLSLVEGEGLPWVNVAEFDQGAELRQSFLIQELPTTFLLDREGRIVARDVGVSELESHLERLFTEE